MDDLQKIKGIGPIYSACLAAVGIGSFRQLAEAREIHLEVVCGIKSWQKADVKDWQHQAREQMELAKAAAIVELRRIKGIGPIFAEKLFEAGMTSIDRVAYAHDHEMQEILDLTKSQAGARGVADWIAQAKKIYEVRKGLVDTLAIRLAGQQS